MKNKINISIINIILGILGKTGGIPWVVKPSNKNCLILGIGSSHKINRETGEILKYFAYTVCLDSSGLYKTLEVLADEESEVSYLEKLTANLVTILKEQKLNYSTCVLHLPFKIKRKEVAAISDAIKQINDIELIVVKINVDNKYFGYSFHNTLVPYESSFVKLSKDEYLVWDADTIPLNHLEFKDHDGRYLFMPKTEHHAPYFSTIDKLFDAPKKADYSFISEHMIFNVKMKIKVLPLL